MKIPDMIKKYFILIVIVLFSAPDMAAQQTPLKREVTLYNPYKPSLNESKKMNYMPDMTDTAQFRPKFNYNVTTIPFMPAFTVSPIKPATLQPDPLDKLYRSYVKLGFGSYVSPFAEVSITNERSKKGALGFYGKHYSNNGNISLENGQKVFAGYMDNDLSLFGRKFFRGVVAGASIDYMQRSRHAYGFNPEIIDYFPEKKETKRGYGDIGATVSVSSTTMDSSRFAYDFNLGFDYLYDNYENSRNRFRFSGEMAKVFKGFFAGAGLDFKHFTTTPAPVNLPPRYVAAINPFVRKTTKQWNFKIGMQALLEKNIYDETKLHIYPDLGFGFSIVQSYINFYSSLTGNLKINDPLYVIEENPFIQYFNSNSGLYFLPNTDNKIVVKAGLNGNTGLEGNYDLSVSYSLVDDMLFYSNVLSADSVYGRGNYFLPETDDVDVLNFHGGLNGKITGKLSFDGSVNFYKYTLTELDFPVNKPEWDATLGFRYNLRDKIIAGVQFTALGTRKQMISEFTQVVKNLTYIDQPWHLNLNLSAEYRYSKILSFWTKFNNLSYQRYYEWAYYPTQRFMFMIGFTYSL